MTTSDREHPRTNQYQEYLRTNQYKDSSNLQARIRIHQLFSTNTYPFHRWVFDHFNIPHPARILEAGCGPGYLWTQNRDRIPEDWNITLSDFSAGMVQEVQHNLSKAQGHFSFQLFDIQSIPFEDAHFDAVIANHMLYHVPDRQKALSEIRRVLKPGGHLYAVTNGQKHMQELYQLLKKFNPALPDPRGDLFSLQFGLENGAEQVAPWFKTITLYRYEDGLVVAEVSPLVAYVLSTTAGQAAIENKVAEFTQFLENELATHGAIHITKDTGMFESY
jgi:ubiquinone/menaquinone biosynthesis C-methylase UbiE